MIFYPISRPSLDPLNERFQILFARELHYSIAALADQCMPVAAGGSDIAVAPPLQMNPAYETQLTEHLQGSIYSGQSQLGVDPATSLPDFFRSQVFEPILDHPQYCKSLWGQLVSVSLQSPGHFRVTHIMLPVVTENRFHLLLSYEGLFRLSR